MTPFEIIMILEIATLADMRSSRSWGVPIYSETLRYFAEQGLIKGPQIDFDCPELTDRGRAYLNFLQAMPFPVANWSVPGPWNPSSPQEILSTLGKS